MSEDNKKPEELGELQTDSSAVDNETKAAADGQKAEPVAPSEAAADPETAQPEPAAETEASKPAEGITEIAQPHDAAATVASFEPAAEHKSEEDADKEAKAKAAAEARAARAAARAAKAGEAAEGGDAPAEPKPPSPNQPLLDRLVEFVKRSAGEDAVEQSWINERNRDMPSLYVKNERWLKTAGALRADSEWKFNFLRNVSGVDYETHMEVVYHMVSLDNRYEICVKVKTDRDGASVPSVTPIWATADWNEREIYDLLGIDFPGHPDLCRIMMPDDWIGHPLRKDYEPLDPEV